MINGLAQGLLDSAGIVASCFITPEAPQFVVMQGAVAIVLLVSIVAVLAFWPLKMDWQRINRICQRLRAPRSLQGGSV
jgi:hypothetical protein